MCWDPIGREEIKASKAEQFRWKNIERGNKIFIIFELRMRLVFPSRWVGICWLLTSESVVVWIHRGNFKKPPRANIKIFRVRPRQKSLCTPSCTNRPNRPSNKYYSIIIQAVLCVLLRFLATRKILERKNGKLNFFFLAKCLRDFLCVYIWHQYHRLIEGEKIVFIHMWPEQRMKPDWVI